MKKLLIITLAMFAICANAQITSPRFGTLPNENNTGSGLRYAIITTTDVTAATIDTITFIPNAYQTIWRPAANLADSVVVKFSSTTTNYRVGDSFDAFLTKGSGNGRIKFGGSKIATPAAAIGYSITASKKFYIKWKWDGSKWIECAHTLEN